MEMRWAEGRGFAVELLEVSEGEEAGIKSATFRVSGENAYGLYGAEKGVHRLVRLSPFDSANRRQTSFAGVEVAPVIDDDTEVEINPDDLQVDNLPRSGAGGQHVNKTDSAVRITHRPSGIVVQCQNERSQTQNRETAMKMLRSKLVELREREHAEELAREKGGRAGRQLFGSQIRSYVLHPYTMVKDHRTNFEVGNAQGVLDGDLDGFIRAELLRRRGPVGSAACPPVPTSRRRPYLDALVAYAFRGSGASTCLGTRAARGPIRGCCTPWGPRRAVDGHPARHRGHRRRAVADAVPAGRGVAAEAHGGAPPGF